jgi:antitoxin CcdA
MGYDAAAPKRPVNLNLNTDLVECCRSPVGNLSAYVESLLGADLEQRANAAAAESRRTERAVEAFSALYEAHGSLSEEMQNL